MCGLTGIIDCEGESVSESLIRSMTDTIAYRGPDDHGYFVHNNFALGHRRLSILDLSAEGHQPMHYLDRYVIVYNGEIYNYIELRETLENNGYRFRSKTDTEVIAAAYDLWNEACQDKFNGMWAFALYDRKENTIFCSRDRFGVKPFYYYRNENWFAFGSEIKVFTVLPGWKAEVHLENLTDFLVFGIFNHRKEVLFNGVCQLRGGHSLKFNLHTNKFEVKQWYDLASKIKLFTGATEDALRDFRSLFEDSISLRLRSDVKVGSCLSGGLDSSSIVGVVNSQLKGNFDDLQNTVSSCFTEKKFDEQNFIDEVVAFTRVKSHKVFPDFAQLIPVLEKISWHHDNPLGSASSFAQWYVFAEAKKNDLIVMLDGQGADEILAGYASFLDANLIHLFRSGRWTSFKKELNANRSLNGKRIPEVCLAIGKSYLPESIFRYLTAAQNRKKYPWLKSNQSLVHPFLGGRSLRSIKGYSLQQILFTSLPMLLHSEDRNSMAFSVESRVPFLDYRLVEFVLSLPPDLKIKNGTTKYIMREALRDYLPEKVRSRTDKMGFVTPEQTWITDNQSQFVNLLSESADRFAGIINKEKLIQSFREDVKSGIPAGSVYWRTVSANFWARAFDVTLN